MRIACWVALVINIAWMASNAYFAYTKNDIGSLALMIINATVVLFVWATLLTDNLMDTIYATRSHPTRQDIQP